MENATYFVTLKEVSSEEWVEFGPYLEAGSSNGGRVHLPIQSPLIVEDAVYDFSIHLDVSDYDYNTETIIILENSSFCKYVHSYPLLDPYSSYLTYSHLTSDHDQAIYTVARPPIPHFHPMLPWLLYYDSYFRNGTILRLPL